MISHLHTCTLFNVSLQAVAWHIAHSRTNMSAGQLSTLGFALGGEPNARPVQPIDGRVPIELAFGPGGASTNDGTASGSYGGSHGSQSGEHQVLYLDSKITSR